tara:strand:- start:42 stop:569 length:528 start_codon:yes stop_codon:yes gene_type:complete
MAKDKNKDKKPNLKLVSDKVKITKIPKAKDQPLTSKQLEFAQLVADGFTKADAFRKAYDVSPDTKEKSIHEMASKTFNNVKVISRIKAIQHQKAEDQRMLGIKQSEFIMKQLEKEAMNMDNNSASRIRALELMGKTHMVGLFADKLEIKSENINMTADELEDQLKDKLQKLLGNN